MASFSISSFGHPTRHYSAVVPPGKCEGDEQLAQGVALLLRKYDDEISDKVRRTLKQWNNVIRDQLRNEMGLRLTIGDEAQAVPIRVMDGMPAPFGDLVGSIEPAVWAFLLRLPLLETTAEGLKFVEREFPELHLTAVGSLLPGLPASLSDVTRFVQALVSWLKKQQLQETIAGIHQDILGAYFFRVPEVSVYWMVIGLMSGVLGVSVDALTVVVVIHELAHAYSHLGRDIDGSRWETEPFARADLNIVEGIAQFYTAVICRKLQARFPGAEYAFRALLEYQSGPYRVHEVWTDPDLASKNGSNTETAGEVVRSCLIESRKASVTSYPTFHSMLHENHGRLRSRRSQLTRTL